MLTFIHNIYKAHKGLTWNEIQPKSNVLHVTIDETI